MKKTVLAALLVTAAFSAQAATDFSFRGDFTGDADVLQFVFSVGDTSTVTLRSYSYAGGTQADGTVIAAGGFDPILALWDGAGNLIQQYDDGPEPVPADPVTGREYDTNLIISNLLAGSYTATIAEFNNFAAGTKLSDGFSQTSSTFTSTYGCSNGQFCDVGGNNRTSAWAFDVLGVEDVVVVDPNVVPLPATLPLMLAAVAGFSMVARRRK